jgi:hypothetical protein
MEARLRRIANVIAYKFLAPGAVGPFTEFHWPSPGEGGPGAWVSAPAAGPPDLWIHACRMGDLPYWLDEELWRVELAEPVRETEYQVASSRARLLARVDGWCPATARSFAEACAWRGRDLAAAALGSAGLRGDAEALLGHRDLTGLAAARATPEGERLVGYVRDAAACVSSANAATTSFVVAALAGEISGSANAVQAEREWQARWLAERLGL